MWLSHGTFCTGQGYSVQANWSLNIVVYHADHQQLLKLASQVRVCRPCRQHQHVVQAGSVQIDFAGQPQ